MSNTLQILDPKAPANAAEFQPSNLKALAGATVGFIDNAKLNFNHLVDDLGELLERDYGVARIVKHRKRGQVPVGDEVMQELSSQCDAVITGSGD